MSRPVNGQRGSTTAERRSGNLLLIAVRAPVAGETKTRLGATIGMERAARVYAAFLEDLALRFMPSAAEAGDYDLRWAVAPSDSPFRDGLTKICDFPPPAGVQFVEQVGDDWTIRQINLLRWGHDQGYERTVLIASDSPHLDREIPMLAFRALEDHDIALGRVSDGGYYLIGQRGAHDILKNIEMSTDQVAEQIVRQARGRGLRLAELPATFDIDDGDDLARLRCELAPDGIAAPATWRALHELGLVDTD